MMHIAVFCGACAGRDPRHAEVAREVGASLARRGLGVVYGGGHVGLMGVVADAAMAAGGHVVGVIPGFMTGRELAHERVSELIVVKDMHQRKMLMHERSQAVMALPGGFGTMDELFEILTLRQTRKVTAMPIVLFDEGYWREIINFDALVKHGVIDAADLTLFRFADTAETAWEALIEQGLDISAGDSGEDIARDM